MLSYHLLDNIKLFSGHAYYRVMVTPENDRIYYNKEEIHLENGMRAELTLFLENRKIYQWMISPLYDVVKSAQVIFMKSEVVSVLKNKLDLGLKSRFPMIHQTESSECGLACRQ
jgi:hypothetical protein